MRHTELFEQSIDLLKDIRLMTTDPVILSKINDFLKKTEQQPLTLKEEITNDIVFITSKSSDDKFPGINIDIYENDENTGLGVLLEHCKEDNRVVARIWNDPDKDEPVSIELKTIL